LAKRFTGDIHRYDSRAAFEAANGDFEPDSCDYAGNVIETHEHAGDLKEP